MRILALIFLLIPTLCFGEYLFTEKSGNSFVWKSYHEQDGEYCTTKYGGKFCVDKKSIASIKEVHGSQPLNKVIDKQVDSSYVSLPEPVLSADEKADNKAADKKRASRERWQSILDRPVSK